MEGFTLISDRDKGLLKTDRVFPFPIRAWCCFQLSENVKTAYGFIDSKGAFWEVARACTEVGYRSALAELQEMNSCAAHYIANISLDFYARSHFSSKQCGHNTSNIMDIF